MEIKVVKVPVLDTGIGREAGYEDDAAMMLAAQKRREEFEAMLTPEALARVRAIEAEAERRFFFGDDQPENPSE